MFLATDGTKTIKWFMAVTALFVPLLANGEISKDETLVLMWSPYYDADVTNDYLKGCPELNCRITYDRAMYNESEAVVFYDRTLNVDDLPQASDRRSNQHFVFFLMETPYYKSPEAFELLSKDFYTLTMTNRKDSDIYSPFGYFKKRSTVKNKYSDAKKRKMIEGKKKMIAWMGSNCLAASKRHLYMNELAKHVPVDIYGKCGSHECPKTESVYTEDDPCEQNMRDNYKFYLAFENSVCPDFVTEKVYNRAPMFLVPLVLNRTIYEAHLPDGSFIAADDFGSPKELADYLYYLHNNDDAYVKYFKWMDDYDTVPFPNGIGDGFCRLCRRLNEEKANGKIEISAKARDLQKWFVQQSGCNPTFVTDLLEKARSSQ